MVRRDLVHRAGTTYERRARATALDRGEHGTLACYRSECRCTLCVDAMRDYYREHYAGRQIERQGSSNRRVPIGPSAARLVELRARGWGWAKLAAECGCSIGTLARIVREHALGTRARTWSTIERAVLAIDPVSTNVEDALTSPNGEDALSAPRKRGAPPRRERELGADELAGLAERGYRTLFAELVGPVSPNGDIEPTRSRNGGSASTMVEVSKRRARVSRGRSDAPLVLSADELAGLRARGYGSLFG